MKGIGEKYLGHLIITSNSSHFFNKTDFEQYLFQYAENHLLFNSDARLTHPHFKTVKN